ncbi:MAG: hypothetical protein HY975_00340 [Candidatus Kerfeldbacteria bacterium]|nr:hypothetical protein [Candidatus Kerfeldbacteria bacterium]
MNVSLHSLRRIGTTVLNRPGVVLGVLVVAWLIWSGWVAWSTIPDQLLPPERITAKQIRVNTTQYTSLERGLTSYHKPATITDTFPSRVFVLRPAP